MNRYKYGDSFLFGLLILLVGSIIRIGASIYLPAMPIIGEEFGISSSQMSDTITVYFIIFSSFIIISGILSDRYGRKPVLLFGITVFMIGSSVCALSNTYEMLLVGRAVQAFGASMIPGTLIAMIQDSCLETRAISLIGWLGVLSGLFLVASPMIGGFLTHYISWRANFWFLGITALIVLFVSFVFIKETNVKKIHINLKEITKLLFRMISSKKFTFVLMPTILFFMIQGVFLALSPYIVMKRYLLSPIEFGISNIFVLIGLFSGKYAGMYLFKRCQVRCVYSYGLWLSFVSGGLFLLYGVGYLDGLWWFLGIMGIFSVVFGMIMPLSMRGSVAAFAKNSGIAASLQGAMLLGASAVGSFIVGSLIHTIPHLEIYTVFGVVNASLCFIVIYFLLKQKKI